MRDMIVGYHCLFYCIYDTRFAMFIPEPKNSEQVALNRLCNQKICHSPHQPLTNVSGNTRAFVDEAGVHLYK